MRPIHMIAAALVALIATDGADAFPACDNAPYCVNLTASALVKGGGFTTNNSWIVLGQALGGRIRTTDLNALPDRNFTVDLGVIAVNADPPPPLATDAFWIPNGPGFYSVAGNWSTNPDVPINVPARQYNVYVNPASAVVSVNTSPTISQLSIAANAAMQVDSIVNQTLGLQGPGINASNAGHIRASFAGSVIFSINDMNLLQTPTGTLEAGGGSTLRLVDSRVTGGTLMTSGSGVIALRNSTVVDADVRGLIVDDNDRGLLQGGIANSAEIRVKGTAFNPSRLEPASVGAVVSGTSGSIVLTSQAGSKLGSPLGASGPSLTNEAGHTIRGQGQIVGPILNRGLIKADVPTMELQIASIVTGTGTIIADQGALHVITGSVAGSSLSVMNNGQSILDGLTTAAISGAVTIDSGGAYKGNPGSLAQLTSGSIEVVSSGIGGQFILSDFMRATTTGLVRVRGCLSGLRGCIPPVLRVAGGARLTVGTNLIIETAPIEWTSTEPIFLAGNFDNQFDANTASPSNFNSASGSLTLNGSAPQTVEAAGNDIGPFYPAGFTNNFAMGMLRIEPGRTVDVVNDRDNDPGLGCEAMYVSTLSLGAGSTLRLNGCNLYYRTLSKESGASVVLLGGSLFTSTSAGDMDGNMMVDTNDIGLYVSVVLNGACVPTPACLPATDMNGDGMIDGRDLALFVRLLTGW